MKTPGVEIAPGAIHFKGWLSSDEQRELAAEALAIGAGIAGFYTPVVRGGHPMSVRMLSLGRHWNALTYKYETQRSDIDGLPVPRLPSRWAEMANRAAADAGFGMDADLCIVNWYVTGSRMGLHQDKDESPASLEAGIPIVSFSIGDTARFLFGGSRRKERAEAIALASGDAFVFGGRARLTYNGVSGVAPGTAPKGLDFQGRLNFTFRQF
jgi:DNA oxidative demethylase